MERILLVDDEVSILRVLCMILGKLNFETIPCSTPEEALVKLKTEQFDLMITDLRLSASMDGLELMRQAKQIDPQLAIVMITAHATVNVAVEAMKEGAYDFVTKPFKMDKLADVVKNALHHSRFKRHVVRQKDVNLHYGCLVGESEVMLKLYDLIKRVAKAEATVLIQGESGTGKELVARAIHENSKRGEGPWVPLNCAAIPENLLESEIFGHVEGAFTGASRSRDGMALAADKGTLFLDEISTMDLNIQSKFLRVLQEHEVKRIGENQGVPIDVRVIAATNECLRDLVDEGQFREDLFYRINVIPVELPPLRRRVEDIPALITHFCSQEAAASGNDITISDGAVEALVSYSWPGNVRELQNALACATALSDGGKIEVENLPPNVTNSKTPVSAAIGIEDDVDRGTSLRDFLKQKEHEYMGQVLEKTGGNRAKAATLLGISRASLYRKLPDSESN